MKELTDSYGVNPGDFCSSVPKMSNREHAKKDDPLNEIFSDEKYKQKLVDELSKDQYEYVCGLLDKLSEKFAIIGDLRIAMSKGLEIFDPLDPDSKYDLTILKRIYFN